MSAPYRPLYVHQCVLTWLAGPSTYFKTWQTYCVGLMSGSRPAKCRFLTGLCIFKSFAYLPDRPLTFPKISSQVYLSGSVWDLLVKNTVLEGAARQLKMFDRVCASALAGQTRNLSDHPAIDVVHFLMRFRRPVGIHVLEGVIVLKELCCQNPPILYRTPSLSGWKE